MLFYVGGDSDHVSHDSVCKIVTVHDMCQPVCDGFGAVSDEMPQAFCVMVPHMETLSLHLHSACFSTLSWLRRMVLIVPLLPTLCPHK